MVASVPLVLTPRSAAEKEVTFTDFSCRPEARATASFRRSVRFGPDIVLSITGGSSRITAPSHFTMIRDGDAYFPADAGVRAVRLLINLSQFWHEHGFRQPALVQGYLEATVRDVDNIIKSVETGLTWAELLAREEMSQPA
jgi:hypothetical protein